MSIEETEKLKKEIFTWVSSAVENGIVSSKVVDSNFWGEFEKWKAKKDLKDEQMHDSILRIDFTLANMEKQLKEYASAKKDQNGRIDKLEATKNFSSGGIRTFIFVIPFLLALASAFFYFVTDSIENRVNFLETIVHQKK